MKSLKEKKYVYVYMKNKNKTVSNTFSALLLQEWGTSWKTSYQSLGKDFYEGQSIVILQWLSSDTVDQISTRYNQMKNQK